MSNRYSFSRTGWLRYSWLLLVAVLFSNVVLSQAATYNITTSSGTYTPITGGTVLFSGAALDNQLSSLITINSFTYNGTAVTSMSVSANGWIAIGGTAATTSGAVYTPISSAITAAGGAGAICAFAADLGGIDANTECRWEYLAGSNETVVQWRGFRRWAITADGLNFQIRLNHTNNTVSLVYGTMAFGATTTYPQVGIKTGVAAGIAGTTASPLRILNIPTGTTCSWVNAVTGNAAGSNMYANSANAAINCPSGTTFTFTPQTGTIVSPVVAYAAASGITSSGASIGWTAPANATQYNVQYRAVGTCAWTDFPSNPVTTNSATITGLNPATSYQVRVQSASATNLSRYSHPALVGTNTDGYTTTGYFTTLALNCTVITAGGTTTSTANPVCAVGGSFTLNVTGATSDQPAGVAFQWFSSPDNSTYTLIPTATAASFTTTYTADTWYRRETTCTATSSVQASTPIQITLAAPLATPVLEPFNTYLPTCWFEATGGVTNPITVTPGANNWGTTLFANTGSNNGFKINLFGTNNAWVVSPRIDLGAGNKRLGFTYAVTSFNGTVAQTTMGSHNVRVIVSTDGGATWDAANIIRSFTGAASYSNTGVQEFINLTGYTGVVRIAFVATTTVNTPDIDFHLDNIIVEEIPTCFQPTAITATLTSATTANLAWTAPTSGVPVNYEWEVRSSGAPGSGPAGLLASGSTVHPAVTASVTGLLPYTSYTLYVRTDCSAGDFSSWGSSAAFSSRGDNCLGAANLALLTSPLSSSTPGLNNDFGQAQISAASGTNTAPDDIFFIDVPACATLTIQMTASSFDNATALRRGGSCPGTIQISSFDADLSTHTYVNTASVPERVWYLVDGWGAGSGTFTFNWSISTACQAPQALTATPVGTGANASWTSCTSAVGYEWQLQTPVGAQGTNVVQSGSGTTPTTLALSGLASLTPYRLWVRNDCGSGNFSSWVSFDFTSLCAGTPTAGTITPSTASQCLNGPNQTFTSAGQSAGAGFVYQWQQSPDGIGSWTNVPGATTANLVIQATQLVRYYRQVTTCTGSGLTAISNVVQLNGTTGVGCSAAYGVARNASATYTPLFPAGTAFTWQGTPFNGDDVSSNSVTLPFTFNYFGVNYTAFRVNTNGFLSMGGTLTGSNFTNDIGTNTATRNAIIAPLWDDLITPGNTVASLSFISYSITGDAPNRVLTVEWAGMEKFNYAGPNMNFQVRLYETTNVIEFVYGSMTMHNGTSNSANAPTTYSLGINSATTGAQSITNLVAQQQFNTNIFGGLAQNGLTVVPECNTSITFTPGGSIGVGTPLPAITNDEPATALPLTVGTSSPAEYCGWNRSTGATASAGIPVCSDPAPGVADDDVWFTFNNPSAQNIRVSVVPEVFYNAVVQVFSDAGVTSIACSNTAGVSFTENVNFTNLAAGNYWVRVYDAATGASAGGHFHISVFNPPPVPANDNPQAAIALAASSTCTPVAGTSLGATAGDPAGIPPTGTTAVPATGNAGIDDDVWYSFVPTTSSAEIRVQSGTGYNAAFQLYNGGVAPGTFTAAIPAVGGEINATSTLGLESNLYTTLIPGNTYFVRVYHVSTGSGPTGSFTICRRDVCPAVTAFAASANNATLEATFTWTGGNADVFYGTFPQTAPTVSTPATQSNITSPAVITGLAANTSYQVWVRSNCGAGFVGDWVGPFSYFTGYCPPTGGTVYGITNVTTTGGTANFNNTSAIGGVAGSGYQNYSASVAASNYEGNATTINISTNTGTHFFYVWIDWNGDFDFADANETIAATTTFAASFTGTINIPTGTAVGAYRMRVANTWSGAITPCGPGPNSEYEDYTFNVVPIPTCFAPTGVTASINSSTSATISWTAATPAPASGYQYFVSTSTTPPTAATTPTGSVAAGVLTASLTGLLAETNYNVWVRSNCGAGDISAWSSPAAFFTGYCQFTHTNTSDEISSFSTTGGNANINNSSTGTQSQQNFVAQAVTGFEGQTINFSATYVGGAAGFSVWVDWNNNLTFETSERVFNATATASTHSGSFTIPTPQAFGNYRMRIAAWWNNLSPSPCGVVGWGQAEDYTLTVLEPVTCLSNENPGTITGPSNICPGVPFQLESSIETIGTEYIWQRRTGATWVTIPAATTRIITVSQTVATDYRVRIGCSLDNTTATSPSTTLSVAINPFSQCYCASSYGFGTTDNDGISNVTLGSINNTSGLAPAPFTATFAPGVGTTTSLAVGSEASGSVTLVSTFGDLEVAAWIDYNRNGTYEASERITQSDDAYAGGATHSFNFVVPANAIVGTTGMRVRTVYLVNDINPCDAYGYGETENYTVTIVPGSANDARVNAQPVAPAVFPGCSNITGNLANATPSQGTPGNDLWYRFTASSNAVRIQLTGAQDCAIELEDAAGTTIDLENATTASGNEVLAVGNLTIGAQYWVAVRSQNATPANFTCCIQALNDSRCDSGPNFSSLCNTFKVDWTGTPNYVARFTETAAPFATFTVNLPNATSIPLRNITGLQHNRSYNVSVDAIYTVVDAGGNTSTITATSNETCAITIAQHPLTNLRSLDRDPATRAIGAFISTDINVCSVTNWEWTFELVDNNGVPTSLDGPISVLANSTSRFIRTSQIPNVAPGNRYRVRVRPIFASGPGVFDDVSLHYLRIASSAGMVDVFDNTANPEQVYFERNTENGVFAALYPNPNNGDMVNLNLAGIDSDNVNVRIMDASGRIVWTNRFVVDGALNTIIAFDRPLTSGIYLVEMTYDNEVITERMMVTK